MNSSFPTPLLRVSRPVSACSKCRSAKIKCDGKLPACTACERSGRRNECSSANDQFAKGKERSYVASLESRVEKLEKQISQSRVRRRSIDMLGLGSLASTLQPFDNITLSNRKNQRREACVVDDLVSDFGFLSVNATARDFYGFTKEISFAKLVLLTSSLQRMPKFKENALPPRYAITPLLQHYLDNIHVLYPFLSETKLFTSLDALYYDSGRHANATDHWTVRLVLAIALSSLSRQRGDVQYHDANCHAAAAFEWTEMVLQPGSIIGIQAILLLVLYAMLDPHHFNSWYLIGVASRAMVDLGIHQDSAEFFQVKDSETDSRRRIYLSVYALDRAISLVHFRAFSFTDDSATEILSSGQKPYYLNSNSSHDLEQPFLRPLDPAIQLFQLRHMQSCAYQILFQSSREKLKEPWQIIISCLNKMFVWAEQIPMTVRRPIKKLFRSELLYASILVLSPDVLTGVFNSYGKALVFTYADEYADIMSSMSGGSEKFAFYTSHDVLRASFVAERFIEVLHSETVQLLDEGMPGAPSTGGSKISPPRSLPNWGPDETLDHAIICLERLEKIIEFLGLRYDYSEPLRKFKADSRNIKQNLVFRKNT